MCLEGPPGGHPPSPLHLHLIDIPLNTLWFDNFPLLISLIAAPEALHMASHCQKRVPFVFNRPPPTLIQATS